MIKQCRFYLAAFICIISLPVPALAETAAKPPTPAGQDRNWFHATNDAGFHTALPVAKRDRLVELIRIRQAALAQREETIARYLDKNRLDAGDALITVILPGGLLYAAVRKANLEEAQAKLAEVTRDLDELDRDLLAIQAMQAGTRGLTVAQLQ